MIKIKKLLSKAGIISSGIFYLIVGLGGIAIHLWTILLSLGSHGIIGATISFITPLASEVYWIFKLWGITGMFFNIYTVSIVLYIVMSVFIMFIISRITSSIENKKEESHQS